jgi:predicted small lipoprotein YifL
MRIAMRLRIFLISFLFALSACAESGPYVFPDRAAVDKTDVEEAIQTQKDIDSRSALIAPEGVPWFAVIEGTGPVIVTAPHATRPFRDGEYRFADGGGTAALAKALSKLTDATVMYTTFASPSDPNYEDDNDFKRELEKLIEKQKPRLIIDIHASHAYSPYDVDLGTMYGTSMLGNEVVAARLIETLRAEGIRNISYNTFAATKHSSITKFATRLGVAAIQMEINKTWLTPAQGDLEAHRFAQLLQAMVRYIVAEKSESPDLLIPVKGMRLEDKDQKEDTEDKKGDAPVN